MAVYGGLADSDNFSTRAATDLQSADAGEHGADPGQHVLAIFRGSKQREQGQWRATILAGIHTIVRRLKLDPGYLSIYSEFSLNSLYGP